MDVGEEYFADRNFTILGIDPGTTFTGFCVITADIEELTLVHASAWSVNAGRLSYYDPMEAEGRSDRFARISALMKYFRGVLNTYNPLFTCSETPFFNRKFPGAYGPLVEVVAGFETVLRDWDYAKTLAKIPPSNVKLAVGAAKLKGKTPVKEAVCSIPELQQALPHLLDEHGLDALAVAYSQLVKFREESHERHSNSRRV